VLRKSLTALHSEGLWASGDAIDVVD
jgi:hypothetical protein